MVMKEANKPVSDISPLELILKCIHITAAIGWCEVAHFLFVTNKETDL
jgi:hypothetical protein